MTITADPTTCGVPDHPADCLCDVVITTPVEVRYGFDEVWGADVVRRAKGWDGEEGGAALADFLEALAYGYDHTRQLEGFDADWTHDGGHLRKQVLELLASGVSIIDLPSLIGDSFARIVSAITDGHTSPVWLWDEPKWAEWEDAIRRPNTTAHTISKQFGLAQSTTRRMMAKWGAEVNDVDKKARLDRIKQLAAEDMGTAEIAHQLVAEGYVPEYSTALYSSVRRITDRMKRKRK